MSKKIIHFISAVSNLIYRNPDAAGDISCVMIDGISYYPRSQPEPADASARLTEFFKTVPKVK